MILSDRVSGKLSWGAMVLIAGLAAVVVPAWTTAQSPLATPVSADDPTLVTPAAADERPAANPLAQTTERPKSEDGFDSGTDEVLQRIQQFQQVHAEELQQLQKLTQAAADTADSKMKLMEQELKVLRARLEMELAINEQLRSEAEKRKSVPSQSDTEVQQPGIRRAGPPLVTQPLPGGSAYSRRSPSGWQPLYAPPPASVDLPANDDYYHHQLADLYRIGYVDSRSCTRCHDAAEQLHGGTKSKMASPGSAFDPRSGNRPSNVSAAPPAQPAAQPSPSRREFDAHVRLLKLDVEAAQVKLEACREKMKVIERDLVQVQQSGTEHETAKRAAELRQEQLSMHLSSIDLQRAEGALELFLAQHPQFTTDKEEPPSTGTR